MNRMFAEGIQLEKHQHRWHQSNPPECLASSTRMMASSSMSRSLKSFHSSSGHESIASEPFARHESSPLNEKRRNEGWLEDEEAEPQKKKQKQVNGKWGFDIGKRKRYYRYLLFL